MMSNRQNDALFQLIKSLEKAEKRHFKLYLKRSSGKEELKIVRLFDTLDRIPDYDEKQLLKKLPDVSKKQLGNLKSHLYKQLMASQRDLKSKDSIELQLNEMLDNGRILYNKGLFAQSLRFLEKAKEMGFQYGKYNFLSQVISLEKKIEGLHITRSTRNRAEKLAEEALVVSGHIYRVFRLSNLAVRLYSYYIEKGHALDEKQEVHIDKFFSENLPPDANELNGFYEQLYLYQSYCWYTFIKQDFLNYYRYAQKWVDLFQEEPMRIGVETGHYIKGVHHLLNAHFILRNYARFEEEISAFESFYKSPVCQQHDNFRIHAFIYLTQARLNWYLMTGRFKEGLMQVPIMQENLKKNDLYIDQHRLMVMDYKFASLHFGYGDYKGALDFLNRIINDTRGNLRYDLQCYARLMHLMCHYQLGNDMLIESLTKSVYRFFSKLHNLSNVEKAIFAFLRKSMKLNPREISVEMEKLLENIRQYEKDPRETRAFAHLDFISFLEARTRRTTMGSILQDKYSKSKHRVLKG